MRQKDFGMPPREVDDEIVFDIEVRVGRIELTVERINRVESKHSGGIQFGSLSEQVEETLSDRQLGFGLVPFGVLNPQARLHEAKGEAAMHPRSHDAVLRGQGGDVDVAVDDHGRTKT